MLQRSCCDYHLSARSKTRAAGGRQDLQVAASYYETQQFGLEELSLSVVEQAEKLIKNAANAWARLRGDIRQISLHRFPYGLIYLKFSILLFLKEVLWFVQ